MAQALRINNNNFSSTCLLHVLHFNYLFLRCVNDIRPLMGMIDVMSMINTNQTFFNKLCTGDHDGIIAIIKIKCITVKDK